MNIYIADMTKEHIDAIVEIEKESFSLPWSKNAFEESMAYEHTIFLVAILKDTNEPIGYIGMYKIFNEGDITNIAVKPQYRGMGIGKALMREIIDRARELEISQLMLEVRESNQAAIGLYKEMGFENAGIRKNFYEQPLENAIVMFCKLLPL